MSSDEKDLTNESDDNEMVDVGIEVDDDNNNDALNTTSDDADLNAISEKKNKRSHDPKKKRSNRMFRRFLRRMDSIPLYLKVVSVLAFGLVFGSFIFGMMFLLFRTSPQEEEMNDNEASIGILGGMTNVPTERTTTSPTTSPTQLISEVPSGFPTILSSTFPTTYPSTFPSSKPSIYPSVHPTFEGQTHEPSEQHSAAPSLYPSNPPTGRPTTAFPTTFPTMEPTNWPTFSPTHAVVNFVVMGDVPYSVDEARLLTQQLKAMRRNHGEFMIHVGDINSAANDDCEEVLFRMVRNIMLQSKIPTIMIPGDNDWNECPDPEEAEYIWKFYFEDFVQTTNANWGETHGLDIRRDPNSHVNFSQLIGSVLFVGVHITGPPVRDQVEWDTRMADNVNWVEQSYFYYGESGSVQSVVVFGHANPRDIHRIFRKGLGNLCEAWAIPMMYIHGDGHTFFVNEGEETDFDCVHMMQIQVDRGRDADPLKITVDNQNPKPFTLKRGKFKQDNDKDDDDDDRRKLTPKEKYDRRQEFIQLMNELEDEMNITD